MPDYKVSQYVFDLSIEDKRKGLTSLYHTLNDAHLILPEKDWSHVRSGSYSEVTPDNLDLLIQNDLLVSAKTDETAMYNSFIEKHANNFDVIASKNLVTRKCNKECAYCFLKEEPKTMSSDTASAINRFYLHFIKAKRPLIVRDNFIGGEPLLNIPAILACARPRYYFCLGAGIPYEFSITTNGTLLHPEVISKMKQFGLAELNVSVAGPGHIHDRLRPTKNGPGYESTLNKIAAVSGFVSITVECQYDNASKDYQDYPQMLDDFTRHGIEVKQINFSPILPKRGQKVSFKSSMGDPYIFLFLNHEANKRGYSGNEGLPKSICSAELYSKLVFDVDGSILPCPSLQYRELAFGHVETGINSVLESQLHKCRLPDKCINACPFLPLCNGGCRNVPLAREGDFWGKDCNYAAYQVLLEDYLLKKSKDILDPKIPYITGVAD